VAIAALWATLLDVPKVDPTDRFFALGGTSLLAARMILEVRDVCRAEFPLQTLYESDRLRDFVGVVRAAQKGAVRASAEATGPETWKADAILPENVRATIASAEPAANRTVLDGNTRIFLTGATGFLGGFLLRELLVRGHRGVRCLVRAQSQ